jgi:hypothetical protein
MTLHHVYGATVIAFAVGVVAVVPANAQRRDGSLLPQEQSGQVTAVGCLVRGDAIRGGKGQEYVLAHPKKGPVASVPEGTCAADAGADALDLDNTEKGGITASALGRWVEITGRLERETNQNPDDLRELDVASFRLVPVVPPAAQTRAPEPTTAEPQAAPRAAQTTPAAPRAPQMTAAAPPPSLPHTASPLPATGLAGLLSLAAALMLRSFRLRQQG